MKVYVVSGNEEGRIHPIVICGIYMDENKAKKKAEEVYRGYVSEWNVIETVEEPVVTGGCLNV